MPVYSNKGDNMTTANSTQGSRLSLGVQTAFGTPQTTLTDVRSEDVPTVKDPAETGVVPNTTHADVNETEKPITLQRAVDDAVNFKTMVRQADTAGGDSVLKKCFEAGGMAAVEGDTSDISVYTSTSSFTATDDNFGVGYGVNVELDSGQFVPTLIKTYSAGAITPAMALPSAASTSNALNRCVTITPGDSDQITASKLLTWKKYTKMDSGGSLKTIQWQDCGVTSFDEVTMTLGEPVLFGFTFGSSKFTEGTSALGDNDFNDDVAALRFNNLYYEFADANSSTTISSTLGTFISGTFAIRNTAVQVPSSGDTNAVNDICGWIKSTDTTQAYLTIEQLWTQDEFDRWNGTNTSKHIAITQPGNAASDPAWSIVLPNAHMVGEPTVDMAAEMYKVTSTWVSNPAGFSGTGSSDQGNQPWYLLLGEQSA